MAWLERRGTLSRIRFRFGGKKRIVPLKTKKEREANGSLARFEENLLLAERGRLHIPANADVGLYLLTDGKVGCPPQEEIRPEPVTLVELLASYRDNYPKRAAHDETILGEAIPLLCPPAC